MKSYKLTLDSYYSTSGPWAAGSSSIWELVRNTDSWDPLQTSRIRIPIFARLSSDSHTFLAFVNNSVSNNMAKLFIHLVGVNLLSACCWKNKRGRITSLMRKDMFRCQIEAVLSNNLWSLLGRCSQ